MRGFDLSRLARGDIVDIGLFGAARWGEQRSERYVTDRERAEYEADA
jgi:plasmid stabilization system protein ParE